MGRVHSGAFKKLIPDYKSNHKVTLDDLFTYFIYKRNKISHIDTHLESNRQTEVDDQYLNGYHETALTNEKIAELKKEG